MSRATRRQQISQLEAELMQGYYGDLPWQDLPTEIGWYWFRVVPSTAIHGPTRVRLIGGRLLGEVHSDGGGEKPVEHFQRQWAGPLGRPAQPEGVKEGAMATRRGGGKRFMRCPDCHQRQVYQAYRGGDVHSICRSRTCGFTCSSSGGDRHHVEARARLAAANDA